MHASVEAFSGSEQSVVEDCCAPPGSVPGELWACRVRQRVASNSAIDRASFLVIRVVECPVFHLPLQVRRFLRCSRLSRLEGRENLSRFRASIDNCEERSKIKFRITHGLRFKGRNWSHRRVEVARFPPPAGREAGCIHLRQLSPSAHGAQRYRTVMRPSNRHAI